MAGSVLPQDLFNGKKPDTFVFDNIAGAVCIIFCVWAGSQLLNSLFYSAETLQHLLQLQDSHRPQVDISLAVSTVFGLMAFLSGGLLAGMMALLLRFRDFFTV